MATPTIAKDLQASLRRAYEEARKRHHELVTLEHILYALLDDPKASKALDACRANRKKLRTDLERFFDDAMQPVPEDIAEDPDFSPHETVAVQRALNAAAFHAMSSEMTEIDGGNLLIQILREPESHAAYLLQRTSTRRPPRAHRPAGRPRPRGRAHDPGALPPPEEQPAPRGRPGVGKTAIAEGLAQKITRARCPRPQEGDRCTPSTWARCSRAPSSAGSSRSA
jgi:ATP-dependent Clp protease ATP-binding subunit ClpA